MNRKNLIIVTGAAAAALVLGSAGIAFASQGADDPATPAPTSSATVAPTAPATAVPTAVPTLVPEDHISRGRGHDDAAGDDRGATAGDDSGHHAAAVSPVVTTPTPAPVAATPVVTATRDDRPTHDANDDYGTDAATHDAADDHGTDAATHDANDDHGTDAATHDANDDGGHHGGDSDD